MTNQNDSNPRKWELWAKGKKPSMKRRSNSHDYTSRGIYMITMATEGRRPILGKIAELPHSTDENPIAEVVLTPFGEKVKDCWFNIPQYHPMVKPLKLCIMPDHIHGLLFVRQRGSWASCLFRILRNYRSIQDKTGTQQESNATTVCCGKQATTTAYYKEKTSWKE